MPPTELRFSLTPSFDLHRSQVKSPKKVILRNSVGNFNNVLINAQRHHTNPSNVNSLLSEVEEKLNKAKKTIQKK